MKRIYDGHPLRDYLASLTVEAQTSYAERCGTTVGYLRKYLSKGTKLDIKLMAELAANSGGRVPLTSLRDDVNWSAVRRFASPRAPRPPIKSKRKPAAMKARARKLATEATAAAEVA